MPVVIHIITGLNTGGAERALYNVIQGGLAESFRTIVISLTDEGRYGPMLKELGVPVYCLGMKHGLPSISALWVLRRIIRKYQPDVVQGWMYHGNLFASLARFFSSHSSKVVWNVRQCLYILREEKKLTQLVIRLCMVITKKPAGIIYNSQLSKTQHEQLGFSNSNGLVIPNGFDLEHFQKNVDAMCALREGLSLPVEALVIGHVGRFHPMKDHACFIKAAELVINEQPKAFFLLAGTNVDDNNVQIMDLIPEEWRHRFLLLGERNDVHRLYNAMDVFCLSSSSEAFPNVLGEAMSSSLPCITTDVGEAAYIVGETGLVVPPKDPSASASAMLQMLDKPAEMRHSLGLAARLRVEEKFSLKSVVRMYAELYECLLLEDRLNKN